MLADKLNIQGGKKLNIRDLKIDSNCLGKMLLVDVKPGYLYKDGVKQDSVNHHVYSVALPDYGLDKINVKIEGKKLMEKPETNFPDVLFANLEIYVYLQNGQWVVAGRASNIEVVSKKA